jgi:hypothetical protein
MTLSLCSIYGIVGPLFAVWRTVYCDYVRGKASFPKHIAHSLPMSGCSEAPIGSPRAFLNPAPTKTEPKPDGPQVTYESRPYGHFGPDPTFMVT